jgi:hypothetical protein
MSVEDQLGDGIADYLGGLIQMNELESFLAGAAWELDDAPLQVRHVALDSLRLVSEAMNGDWTEEELRDHLRPFLRILTDRLLFKGEAIAEKQLLGKLADAERTAPESSGDEEGLALALMGYAYLGQTTRAAKSKFGSALPSGRGFLRQPRGEAETPHRAEGEPAIS